MFRPPPVKRPSRAPKPLSAESETEPDEDWQFNANLGDGNPKNIRAEHSHYCILLKPQIVLRSELDDESVVILAANDMVLQLVDHMDTAKLPDPVKAYERTKCASCPDPKYSRSYFAGSTFSWMGCKCLPRRRRYMRSLIKFDFLLNFSSTRVADRQISSLSFGTPHLRFSMTGIIDCLMKIKGRRCVAFRDGDRPTYTPE